MKKRNHINLISKTLLYAYRIKPDSLISKNIYVKKVTYLEDTEDWVRNSLLNLDEPLVDCVLPILVERFEEHLSNNGVIE